MPGQKVAKDIDDRNPYFLSLTCGRPRVFDHAIAFEAKTAPPIPEADDHIGRADQREVLVPGYPKLRVAVEGKCISHPGVASPAIGDRSLDFIGRATLSPLLGRLRLHHQQSGG